MAQLWGHKLTIHIYVEGDIEETMDISEEICDFLAETDSKGRPYIETGLVGVTVDPVQDPPFDQVAA